MSGKSTACFLKIFFFEVLWKTTNSTRLCSVKIRFKELQRSGLYHCLGDHFDSRRNFVSRFLRVIFLIAHFLLRDR